MKKRKTPSKGRGVAAKSAKRTRAAASRAARRPRAATVTPKRKPVLAKPRPKPVPAGAKGPSVASLQRRVRTLEEQLRARDQDRAELARWKEHHTQLQELVRIKDSALAFKEKALLDLRRQIEGPKTEKKAP